MIEFMVHGTPIPQGSKRVVPTKAGPRAIDTNEATLHPWRQEIAGAALRELNGSGVTREPVAVRVMFFLPRPKGHFGKKGLRPAAPEHPHVRPDIDKLARAVLDALTGIAFHDDAQVVDLSISKVYADDYRYPGAMISVTELQQTLLD